MRAFQKKMQQIEFEEKCSTCNLDALRKNDSLEWSDVFLFMQRYDVSFSLFRFALIGIV